MNRNVRRTTRACVPVLLAFVLTLLGGLHGSAGAATDGPNDASVSGGTDLAEIQAYLAGHYYAASDIRYSFIANSGAKIDCIDFDAQHSVQSFRAQGVTIDPTHIPPAPSLPLGAKPPHVPPDRAFNGLPDVNGNPRQCPTGTVPKIRPSVAEIQAAGGLAAYLQSQARKLVPPCGDDCTYVQSCFEHDCFLLPQVSQAPPYTYEHASGIQTQFAAPEYGMLTYQPIYNRTVAGTYEHSIDQMWLQTGDCENWYNSTSTNQCNVGNNVSNQAVQSVEVGAYTGYDNQSTAPTLALFFTADGYNFDSCFAGYGQTCCGSNQNNDCFVQIGTQYTPNMPLTPVSTIGDYPNEISVQVWNGAAYPSSAGGPYPGWWIWIDGTLMGWYPPETFYWPNTQEYGPMAFGPATYMQVGGEVYDLWPNGGHTSTAMGSGWAPPYAGYGWAAYDRNISNIDGAGNYYDAVLDAFYAPYCEQDYDVAGVCGMQSGWWTNEVSPGYGAYSMSWSNVPGGEGGPWGTAFFFGGGQGMCVGGAAPPCP